MPIDSKSEAVVARANATNRQDDVGMIERVARAMCAQNGNHESAWWEFESNARAAIAAMRDPTEQMATAGLHAVRNEEIIDDVWQAMIDAALEGK